MADVVHMLFAAEFHDPLLPLWTMELMANAFLWLWLFCLGATVGSFLNVVVYRLPRGLNIVFPGSFCPHCGHPIRLQDNIPLLSWLSLRGRCRDCGGPISPRYFFVELTVAVAFLIVLAAEYYLPPLAPGFHTRHLLTVRDGVPFWCMYFMHVTLVTTLIAAVLMASDGGRVPASLFAPVLFVGFCLPLAWPQMRSVPAVAYSNENVWWAGSIDGIAGVAVGRAWRFLFAALIARRSPSAVATGDHRFAAAPVAGASGWCDDQAQHAGASGWCVKSFAHASGLCGWPLACSVGEVVGWQTALLAVPIVFAICLAAAISLRGLFAKAKASTHLASVPSEQIASEPAPIEPSAGALMTSGPRPLTPDPRPPTPDP